MDLKRLNLQKIVLILFLAAGCARFEPRPLAPSETAANWEARTLDNDEFHGFLRRNFPGRFESWPLKSWDFDSLYLAALYYHPSLDIARAQWQAALGGRQTAAGMLNPTVSAVPGYDINSPAGLTPWFPGLALDIPLETAGKRGFRKAQSRHLSDAARFSLASAAWQVRSNLRARLLDMDSAQQRLTVLQTQKTAQEKILLRFEQQLKEGAVAPADLTMARVALNKTLADLEDAKHGGKEAQIILAEAIGIPAAAMNGLVLTNVLFASLPSAPDLMTSEIRHQALLTRADILSALSEYAASQSGLQLEIAKQYPDIHLGPGYQYDQGDHKISLSLTVELPVLNQNKGPIAEAEARRIAAAARFITVQAKVIADIDLAVASYRAAQDGLAALASMAVSQKKRLAEVEAQWKAGAADQLDVLNSQIEAGATELLLLSGQIKLQQAMGALEDAVQRPMDSLPPGIIEQSQHLSATQEKKQ